MRTRADLERRRLDVELVRRSLAATRAAARRIIGEGRVLVDGVLEPKPATLVDSDRGVRLVGVPLRFVSRGGDKLTAALDAFNIPVANRRAVDVGASTGGFTDCLLQRGAASVVAVDVGYGQLAWPLRSDDRVTVVERTNIRLADAVELGAPFDIVVADLSFIGLGAVAPQLAALGGPASDWVVLVKPQFEVGRHKVERGGVVGAVEARAGAVCSVAASFHEEGVGTAGVIPSPIVGAKAGNREYLLWLRRDAPRPDEARLTGVVLHDG